MPMTKIADRLLQFCKADESSVTPPCPPSLAKLTGAHQALHSLLPYRSYDKSTGLFYNHQSQGFVLGLSPLTGASTQTIKLLTDLLADNIKDKMHAQFLFWANPDIHPYLQQFYVSRSGPSALFQKLAHSRREYLKKGNRHSLTVNGSMILRDFQLYLIVSSPNDPQAATELLHARSGISSTLKTIGMSPRRLNAAEFISLVQGLIHPSDSANELPQWDEQNTLNLQIATAEQALSVGADTLSFHHEKAPWQASSFTVKQFPMEMTQGAMNEAIGRLCDNNNALQIPSAFIFSFHLKVLNKQASSRQAQWQLLQKDRSLRSPLSRFMPTLAQTHAEWQKVRDNVAEGARLVHSYFQAIVLSPKSKHEQAQNALKDLFRANGWQLKPERFLQLPAFLSALPMLMSEGLWEDMKLMGRLRTMTSEQAIHIAPLQGEWKGMSSARMLLPGRRGQMAFWDPFEHQESNYNVAIAARSGAGKSAFTQEYIVAQRSSGARVWVIDVGRSYEKTCELLGGQFIAFEPNSKISLNPFTSVTDINESLTLLKPLFAAMAHPSGKTDDEENTFLEKAIKAAWEKSGNKASVTTVADWLGAQENATCQKLHHLLFGYTTEGMYKDYFNGPGMLTQDNPFIVLEREELKAKKDLQKIILLLLMYHISENMYMGSREQVKSCIIDEAWDLLSEENHAAAHFIETGFRRARRYNANFVTITQSINDYFKHTTALAAFENAFWKVILGQEAESIEQLKQQGKFELDDYSEHLLKSLRKTNDYAECMIKAGPHVTVHRIIFDPFSRVLFSSKGEEFAAVKAYQQQGLSLIQAIEKVALRYKRKLLENYEQNA